MIIINLNLVMKIEFSNKKEEVVPVSTLLLEVHFQRMQGLVMQQITNMVFDTKNTSSNICMRKYMKKL